MSIYKNIQAVSSLQPFVFDGSKDSLFVEAMKENYAFQLLKHPYLAYEANKRQIKLDDINKIEDLYNIPPMFVDLMKYYDFCSYDKQDIALTLTSSGTKGQKTKSYFDQESLNRLTTMAFSVFLDMGYASSTPVHYFIFSYDISKASGIGTSWSDEQMLSLAPKKSEYWMINWDNKKKGYVFDDEKWARTFIEHSQEGPIRLLGFPAYMYQLVETIKKVHGKIIVHPKSFILAGGGWKNHLGKSMTLKAFRAYMEDNIGLPPHQIGDTFGLSEHGIPYCSCPYGHYHVPQYSRVRVCDPVTLATLPLGEEGALHLLTPYNTAQPNLSLLTTDMVRLGEDCPCQREGVYIKDIRRGGKHKHKGCAIAAQEILNKGLA